MRCGNVHQEKSIDMAQCQENGMQTTTTTTTRSEHSQLASLQRCHQRAHSAINKALTLDEAGSTERAAQFYSEGVGHLAEGLSIRLDNSDTNDQASAMSNGERESAGQMQRQMRKTVRQIRSRLEELENSASRPLPNSTTATAATAPELNGNRLAEEGEGEGNLGRAPRVISSSTMQELEENLRLEAAMEEMEAAEQPPSYEQSQADAKEIFAVAEGVQMFFISPEGHVSAPSCPGPLRIYEFGASRLVEPHFRPPAFLQVGGDWLYPLTPGQSPALRSREGAFVFPDLMSGVPGACVGIMFDPGLGREKTERFERAIQELTVLREQREAPARPPPPRAGLRRATTGGREASDERVADEQLSTKIAKGIITGAEWISWGVGKGAEATGYLIGVGKEKLKQNLRTEDTPAQIDHKYQKGAEYAQKASVVAVKVSRVVVDSLCYLTKRLAEEASPYIKEQSDKLLGSKDQPDSKRNKTLEGVVEIAASGLQGFGTVYNGLETAAKALGRSISNATVEVVQHKYGKDAARFTDASLGAATNFGLTAYNLNHIGVKALAKRTATETGKAMIQDYQEESAKKTKEETGGQDKEKR